MREKLKGGVEEKFSGYLKEGEDVLWTGKPVGGIQLRDADIILIPVSIILLGFSVMLDYVMMHFEADFIFKFIGNTFALLAIYIGGIRFILDAYKRKKTFYCITNKRVLLISGRRQKLKTMPLKNIDRLDKTEERNGSGFIIFGSTNPLWPWLLGGFYGGSDTVPGLQMLSNVNQVYAILEDQIKVEIPPALRQKLEGQKKEELN